MTKALILAGGQGTRLRPLTNNKPKCLVELCGISLFDRQVATLRSQGITDIAVATGFCKEQLESKGFKTWNNDLFDKTNMVETLFCAKEFMDEESDLIIGYGDIVYQEDNLKAVLECDAEIALMIDKNWRDLWSLRLENPLDDAETLLLDNEKNILELGKKPSDYSQIQGQYTGLIKVRADKVKDFVAFYEHLDRNALYDGKDFHNMYMTSFLQMLIDSNWQVKAVEVENGWLEVDSVEDLKKYEELLFNGSMSQNYLMQQ
jgi:choline kinase